jgi:uncharacterized protein YlzI (FlbEa/FlbD family)
MNRPGFIGQFKVIVSPLVVTNAEVIENIRLPRRGIVVHHKTTKMVPDMTIYMISGDTLLMHPIKEEWVKKNVAALTNFS